MPFQGTKSNNFLGEAGEQPPPHTLSPPTASRSSCFWHSQTPIEKS